MATTGKREEFSVDAIRRSKVLYFGPTLALRGASVVMAALLNGMDRRQFLPIYLDHGAAVEPRVPLASDVVRVQGGRLSRFVARGPLSFPIALTRLRSAIQSWHPDCVISDVRQYVYASAQVCRTLGSSLPVIARWGSVWSPQTQKYIGESAWGPHLMASACRIAVPSSLVRISLAEAGVPEEKIAVIPNGIDFERLDQLAAEALPDSDPARGRTRFLFVGSMVARKDPLTMVRAAARLEARHRCEFWFVGDGPLRGRLEKLATENGIARNVRFFGYQENPYKFMRNADVLVHTSISDGFALAPIEAAGLGVAVFYADSEIGALDECRRHSLVIGRSFVPGDDKGLASLMESALREAKGNVSNGTRRHPVFGLEPAVPNAVREVFGVDRFLRRYEELVLDVVSRSRYGRRDVG